MRGDNTAGVVQQRYQKLVAEGAPPDEWAYAWRAEINRGGFEAVDFLMDEIVNTGKCVGCAACVTICPTDVFDFANELPADTRHDDCVQCILCADVCPVLSPPDATLPQALNFRAPAIDEGYGLYSYEVLSRATDPKVLARAQDGGTVSVILLDRLERGVIKGAILGDVEPLDPQVGRHILATTPEEILSCQGSRYTYSPNTLAFKEAMERDVRPVAVVGVPCQVDGVRQQQHSGIRLAMNRWFRDNVPLVIGLLCSEAFTHESIAGLSKRFGVDRRDIENINIKGKVILSIKGGRTEELKLKEFQQYARPACLYCRDYSVEQADISAGGIGLDGWTYTVVRTEAGHEAFQAVVDAGLVETRPVSDAPRSKKLMIRLSKMKMDRPLAALLPTLAEREATGNLDPKAFQSSKQAPSEQAPKETTPKEKTPKETTTE